MFFWKYANGRSQGTDLYKSYLRPPSRILFSLTHAVKELQTFKILRKYSSEIRISHPPAVALLYLSQKVLVS